MLKVKRIEITISLKEPLILFVPYLFSGGIDRDWIGVPRKLFDNTSKQDPRCACVKLDSKVYEENRAMLKEYDGCAKYATKCVMEKEA